MTKRILIDGINQEIRVVVTENSKLHDFEVETPAKKPIKGNVYLAKVTRVEPSLQAAFVEYGGNKQGFLPFSEIHPDYFSIPVSDKPASSQASSDQSDSSEAPGASEAEENNDSFAASEVNLESNNNEVVDDVDTISDEAVDSELSRPDYYRKYRIQEVIKRGQVMLVQAIKEERGNKGASLTTFLSLPGRYCVFMPNAERQGGVSRRIDSVEARRKLKAVLDELEIDEGSSIIIRTAGSAATADEIKNDYRYLLGIWEKIKQMTVSSTAPTMIFEEGDLVKRTVRDLYDNSIEEIVIEGKNTYDHAAEIIQEIAPGHLSNLKLHKEKTPIFWHYGVEDELAGLYDNKAYLKSGGYIVINSTEALVAIDVNSGKSTTQRNVEETATKTNLEAVPEIARQLRLRDLSGLIVIDFIDMMELKNRINTERALKDALKDDRARIQVGRISPFGLLEMSRQRLHSSLVEANMMKCQTCNGSGTIKSPESKTMLMIHEITQKAAGKNVDALIVTAPYEIAFHLLNNKREDIAVIEDRYDVDIIVEGSGNESDDYYIKTKSDPSSREKRSKKSKQLIQDIYSEREVAGESLETDEVEQRKRYSGNSKSGNRRQFKKRYDSRGSKDGKSSDRNNRSDKNASGNSSNSKPRSKTYSKTNSKPTSGSRRRYSKRDDNNFKSSNAKKQYGANSNNIKAKDTDNKGNVGGKNTEKSVLKSIWRKITAQ